MGRKGRALFAIVVVLTLAAPSVVHAATGSFSSSGKKAAVRADNTGSGRAVHAVSNRGEAVFARRTRTSGTKAAIFGRTDSNSSGARAIFGRAARPGGRTFGVVGQTDSRRFNAAGVFGLARNADGAAIGAFGRALGFLGVGVLGEGSDGFGGIFEGLFGVAAAGAIAVWGLAGDPGDGTYGIYSPSDVQLDGHLLTAGNVAGTCTVVETGTSAACAFDDPFAEGVEPRVVVTPTSNPGDFFWVSDTDEDGFTINVASAVGGDVVFSYVVVGIDTTLADAGVEAAVSASSGRSSWSDLLSRFRQ